MHKGRFILSSIAKIKKILRSARQARQPPRLGSSFCLQAREARPFPYPSTSRPFLHPPIPYGPLRNTVREPPPFPYTSTPFGRFRGISARSWVSLLLIAL